MEFRGGGKVVKRFDSRADRRRYYLICRYGKGAVMPFREHRSWVAQGNVRIKCNSSYEAEGKQDEPHAEKNQPYF